MKMLSMKLENFQGIRSLSLDFPDGCSGSIYGDNGTGKTTVFNALTWLLFDKASNGAKDFSPKTKDSGGDDIHHLNHGVTASFQKESGEIIALQKVYHEVYKKKKGSATEERSGHTVDYYVNGVPTKERDYTSTILALCGGDAEKPKMLTMPDYFAEQLKWQVRRQILLDVCGDVTDQEIISSSAELRDLPKYLEIPGTVGKMYCIDEYKKIASARLKDLNKQIEEIPKRIDEAEKAIPDTGTADEATVDSAIADANMRIYDLQKERALTEAGNTAETEIRKNISNVDIKISVGKIDYMRICVQQNSEANALVMVAHAKQSTVNRELLELEAERNRIAGSLKSMIAMRESIMREWKTVNAEFLPHDAKTCPTCGRELPEDKVEKIVSDFNLSKSRRLAKLNMRGKKEASKDMIEDLKKKTQELEAKIALKKVEAEKADSEYQDAKALVTQPAPYESTDEYKTFREELQNLQAELQNSGKCVTQALADIDAQIASAREQLEYYQGIKLNFAFVKTQRDRIAYLTTEEESMSREYNNTERGLYLCELFMRAKVDMLTGRINRKFKNVRFRLFEIQENGGLKEGCDVMVPTDNGSLVPYSSANNAARINAGLEIIDTLSEHWGVKLPVMVDNAESITRLAKTNTQTIRLVVSEPDKVLRLEADDKTSGLK